LRNIQYYQSILYHEFGYVPPYPTSIYPPPTQSSSKTQTVAHSSSYEKLMAQYEHYEKYYREQYNISINKLNKDPNAPAYVKYYETKLMSILKKRTVDKICQFEATNGTQ